MEILNHKLSADSSVPFRNNITYCVGTGRMSLALRKEYQDQLRLVQKEIGFKFIRGHGIFNDDIGIYNEYKDADGNIIPEYNFTYLDMVMDFYMSVNIRPFLELGFMPKALSTAEHTVFWWKGYTTPPRDYKLWRGLVQATLRHLCERYGTEEVVTWPVEVWNEPNQEGFWMNRDKDAYNLLFKETFEAVKEVDPRFFVGGPSICEGFTCDEHLDSFLSFCRDNNIKPDFFSRHQYTVEVCDCTDHYAYTHLHPVYTAMNTITDMVKRVKSFPEFADLPMYVTEYNTAYISQCCMHDTNLNATYIAEIQSHMDDAVEATAYWTFGDCFEEYGVPFQPFYGGFGLVANGCIPKPTFWTFAFYKNLVGTCIHHSDDSIVMKREDGSFCGLMWNNDITYNNRELTINYSLEVASSDKTYSLISKLVDEETCNPFKMWHDIGEPRTLTPAHKELLLSASHPLVQSNIVKANGNTIELSFFLKQHALLYFELKEIEIHSDRDFSYERVLS